MWFRKFLLGFFDFKSRTSKDAFWVTIWVMGVANLLAIAGLASVTNSTPEEPSVSVSLLVLASWIPWLALGVRRLHDTNRSGWWILLLATVIGWIPLFWWFLITGGTVGPNRFGPDPLKRGAQNPSAAPAVAVEPNAPSTSSTAAMAQLKTLGELRDSGALSDEEFNQQKARLLGSI